ncbi:MAG: putative beta-lysine N-acetyltransferase [Clostridia bacterium]|nr:putative beta-lysine N-acetyltransferase [Clostridia bacterium]
MKMFDSICKIGNSIIHHGQNSNRIYLMSLDVNDLPCITRELDELAAQKGYTKIIAKIPLCHKNIFETNGYKVEAVIPKFYKGESDGCFLCKYFDEARNIDTNLEEQNKIISIAKQKGTQTYIKQENKGFICRCATQKDASNMVEVYRNVFKTYPFPIHDEEYILKTMSEDVIYFGIWINNKLVALSSIEFQKNYSNAEMTDFAVLDEHRGKGYALYLLDVMENELKQIGIKTAYTIARAKSAGMNITFAKCGYTYAGTLVNNTDISGQIESMNVWYKHMNSI